MHPDRLGPYVINASIGAGGMGEVYRATDTNLKRAVAIKVLLPGGYAGRMYDISPDGERFALDATDSEAAVKQATGIRIQLLRGAEAARADELMALPAGTRIGPYEVIGQIGAGGMGEVYRATDTRLKREVALKILPESFATDAERLARFQREAEVLASLNHPNIAHVHGLERSDGVQALVMELVDGADPRRPAAARACAHARETDPLGSCCGAPIRASRIAT